MSETMKKPDYSIQTGKAGDLLVESVEETAENEKDRMKGYSAFSLEIKEKAGEQ